MPDTRYLQKPDHTTRFWTIHKRIPKDLWEDGRTKFFHESTEETDLIKARRVRDRRLLEKQDEWDHKIAAKEGRTIMTRSDLKNMAWQASERHLILIAPPLGGRHFYPLSQLQDELNRIDEIVKGHVHQLESDKKIALSNEDREFVQQTAKVNAVARLEHEIAEVTGEISPSAYWGFKENHISEETIPDKAWNRGVTGKRSLSQAVAEYKQSEDWECYKSDTKRKYIRTYEILERIISPSRDVGTLLPPDFKRMKDTFKGLPKYYSGKGDPVKVVENTKKEKRIGSETINSHLSAVRNLFAWMKAERIIKDDLAYEKLRMKGWKKDGKVIDRRAIAVPYEEEDLKMMFNRPKDIVWWGAAIGLFTGSRLGEVMQLRPKDIVQQDGVWCFSHNADDENNLKTMGAERLVPIHSSLIKAGFLELVESSRENENGRLFKELEWSEDGKWARIFVRRFDYWTKKKLGIKPPAPLRKSYHSFRHLMARNILNPDDPRTFGPVDSILGWTSKERSEFEKSMRCRYAGLLDRVVPVKELQQLIETVQYSWFDRL